jgi:hypothetical protein
MQTTLGEINGIDRELIAARYEAENLGALTRRGVMVVG